MKSNKLIELSLIEMKIVLLKVVYLDANNPNKGPVRFEILLVNMAIGGFWSSSVRSEEKAFILNEQRCQSLFPLASVYTPIQILSCWGQHIISLRFRPSGSPLFSRNRSDNKVFQHMMTRHILLTHYTAAQLVRGCENKMWGEQSPPSRSGNTVCLQHSRKCSFFLYYYFRKIRPLHPCLLLLTLVKCIAHL